MSNRITTRLSGRARALIGVLVNIIIIATVASVSYYVYITMLDVEENRCRAILEDSVETVEKEIQLQLANNVNILKLFSTSMVIEQRTEDTEENVDVLVSHLNDFQQLTFFDRIDVLLKNNNIILQTGKVRPSTMDFDMIAAKGISVSGRRTDVETGNEVFRCSVPVIKDGEPVAILLGVVNCETLPNVFKSTMYDTDAIVCLVDRATGDFLMDNWDDSLGNIYDMKQRKALPGYEGIDFREEVALGHTGMIGYESEKNGKASYMYYKPFTDLNWQILVAAQEDTVFSSLNTLNRLLRYLVLIIGLMLSAYLAWSLLALRNALRRAAISSEQSSRDTLTGLYNQSTFIKVLDEYEHAEVKGIGLLFLDLNRLKYTNDHFGHSVGDALIKNAAAILRDIFGETVYRIGGDEFVVLTSELSREEFEALSATAKARMHEEKIEVAIGLTWHENSRSVRAQLKEADDLMYMDKKLYHEHK